MLRLGKAEAHLAFTPPIDAPGRSVVARQCAFGDQIASALFRFAPELSESGASFAPSAAARLPVALCFVVRWLSDFGARRSEEPAVSEAQQPRQIFFSFAAVRASSARNGSL